MFHSFPRWAGKEFLFLFGLIYFAYEEQTILLETVVTGDCCPDSNRVTMFLAFLG